MKKYLFGALAVVLAVGFSAFTAKKTTKPTSSQTLYYKAGVAYQRVENNVSTGTPIFRSMNMDPNFVSGVYASTQFRTLSNWSTVAADAGTFSSPSSGDPSTYLWSFDISSYQDMSTVDGDDATGLSAAEALEAVQNYFIANGSLPTSLVVDTDGLSNNDITISNIVVSGDIH